MVGFDVDAVAVQQMLLATITTIALVKTINCTKVCFGHTNAPNTFAQ